MKGKIITIEGLDGSGKSTQIGLLTSKLTLMDIKFKFIHFPTLNIGVYGELIAEYLRGEFGSVSEVHPKLVALLFAENRNSYKNQILDWLNEGYLIILDRYVYSNIAFQCGKVGSLTERTSLKEWIVNFEYKINCIPKPNLSLFLNVPIDTVLDSLSKSRFGDDRDYLNGKIDIHEDSIELQKRVYNEYIDLINVQEDFILINCYSDNMKWFSPEEINNNIITVLHNYLIL